MVTKPTPEFTLVGFTGAPVGNEASLTLHRPVVRVGESVFAATDRRWRRQDLVRVDADWQGHYELRPLPERPITPGQLVWVAGSAFASRCADLAHVGHLLRVWDADSSGKRLFAVGYEEQFVELSTKLYGTAKHQLHLALFEPAHPQSSAAATYLSVLENVTVADESDQNLQRGLFYYEARNRQRLEILAADAVALGRATTRDAFVAAVEELSAWLRRRRIREGGELSRRQGSISSRPARFESTMRSDTSQRLLYTLLVDTAMRESGLRYESDVARHIEALISVPHMGSFDYSLGAHFGHDSAGSLDDYSEQHR